MSTEEKASQIPRYMGNTKSAGQTYMHIGDAQVAICIPYNQFEGLGKNCFVEAYECREEQHQKELKIILCEDCGGPRKPKQDFLGNKMRDENFSSF